MQLSPTKGMANYQDHSWTIRINAAVILQGTLELKLKDGSQKIYQKGDALIEVVNTIHAGKALG